MSDLTNRLKDVSDILLSHSNRHTQIAIGFSGTINGTGHGLHSSVLSLGCMYYRQEPRSCERPRIDGARNRSAGRGPTRQRSATPAIHTNTSTGPGNSQSSSRYNGVTQSATRAERQPWKPGMLLGTATDSILGDSWFVAKDTPPGIRMLKLSLGRTTKPGVGSLEFGFHGTIMVAVCSRGSVFLLFSLLLRPIYMSPSTFW